MTVDYFFHGIEDEDELLVLLLFRPVKSRFGRAFITIKVVLWAVIFLQEWNNHVIVFRIRY